MKKETAKNKKNTAAKHIVIRDGKHGLPYSKGVTASSIMATGISPGRAYKIAQMIEDELREERVHVLTMEELKDLTYRMLAEHVNAETARKYRRWDDLSKVDKPIIVLVGGTTGTGKSTIASELAYRLGFNRMVSTDAIREIMRSFFSPDLMPALYNSSFNAWKMLRYPEPKSVDPVIAGFREQAQAVMVGIEAIIERAINEGINMVIEGAHVLPGFIDPEYSKKAFILPLIIVVKDEEQHKSHFFMREVETAPSRPYMHYVESLDNIRKIQDYIKTLAKANQVPVFSSYNLDATVSKALEYIMDSIFGALKAETPESQPVLTE